MANAVEKVNTIAIASIEAINTITDDNLQALNTLEFTGALPDAHTLIATETVPADESAPVSSIDFESGIDGTYDVYEFILSSLHPSVDAAKLRWRSSTDGGSSYGVTTTTSFYATYHTEDDSGTPALSYAADLDAADSASDDIYLSDGVGFDGDQSASGRIQLFAPSDATFTKHFIAEIQQSSDGDICNISRSSGFINTASAVDAIQFSFDSGYIDRGVIKMFGYELP